MSVMSVRSVISVRGFRPHSRLSQQKNTQKHAKTRKNRGNCNVMNSHLRKANILGLATVEDRVADAVREGLRANSLVGNAFPLHFLGKMHEKRGNFCIFLC